MRVRLNKGVMTSVMGNQLKLLFTAHFTSGRFSSSHPLKPRRVRFQPVQPEPVVVNQQGRPGVAMESNMSGCHMMNRLMINQLSYKWQF